MTIYFNRLTTFYVLINLLFQSNRCRDLPENKSRRVYGGRPVALGEIPYQVGFKTRLTSDPKRFYTFCGGAIIGEAKILSAAHCFVRETPNMLLPGYRTYPEKITDKYAVAATVRNFVYEKENYEQWRMLRNLTYPHNYRFPENDIAVLFVMEPFEFNDLVKPISMADKFIDYEGTCLVSGYGEISHWGDSGGPLVYAHAADLRGKQDRTLIGIASGTYEGHNSIFVRVSSYRAYIARNRCEEETSIYYFVVNTLVLLQNYIDMQF